MLAFCGWSGAGKTTLVEELAHRLQVDGLRVAVVKHDAHGLSVDRPGKDSDRFFQAGADVWIHAPDQGFYRFRPSGDPLGDALAFLGAGHDIVLVEGHKFTPLPKVWVCSEGESGPPEGVSDVALVLRRDEDRVGAAYALVTVWLADKWRERPVAAGVLVGGRSTRMGMPKPALEWDGVTLAERVVVAAESASLPVAILGDAPVPSSLADRPRLPDAAGYAGPAAGMVSASRLRPDAAWVFIAADMPSVEPVAIEWLTGLRRPGVWAVFPAIDGWPEPLFALYEPQALRLLEREARDPSWGVVRLADHEKSRVEPVPAALRSCWFNVNTPDDWEAWKRSRGR